MAHYRLECIHAAGTSTHIQAIVRDAIESNGLSRITMACYERVQNGVSMASDEWLESP